VSPAVTVAHAAADGGSHGHGSHGGAPSQYGAPVDVLGQYGDNFGSASNLNGVRVGAGNSIDDLMHSIPGTPGQDYPILAEVPETRFTCDGRVAGGIRVFYSSRIPERYVKGFLRFSVRTSSVFRDSN